MHRKFINLAVLAATLLSGCVLSFHPLFPEKNILLDPTLVGVWKAKPGAPTSAEPGASTVAEGTFTVSHYPQMGKTYVLETDIKDQGRGKFLAQIGALGTNRFLQIVPSRPDNIHPKTLYGGHFIQSWSFWKLKLEADKLTLFEMNYLWLEGMLKQKKLEIKHEQQEGGFMVLTASTSELEDLVSKHQHEPGFWGKSLQFIRQRQ